MSSKPRSPLSRRQFLRAASGGLAAAAGLVGGLTCGQEEAPPPSPAGEDPATPEAPGPISRVVEVRDEAAISPRKVVDPDAVGRMLDEAMTALTGATTPREAWAGLFGPDDVVGIKINCNGRPRAVTQPATAYAIARGLMSAGVAENNIIIWERRDDELISAGYEINTGATGIRVASSEDWSDFDEDVTRFGSGHTRWSRILSEHCTKIVNAPVLKTMIDRTYGITNAVKFVYGLIDNPGSFHRNAVPAAAELYALPMVRDKTVLVICDALLILTDAGPWDAPEFHHLYHSLLASFDPVAMDVRGFDILEEVRGRRIRPRMPYVFEAGKAKYGLGTADPERIELVRRDLTA